MKHREGTLGTLDPTLRRPLRVIRGSNTLNSTCDRVAGYGPSRSGRRAGPVRGGMLNTGCRVW